MYISSHQVVKLRMKSKLFLSFLCIVFSININAQSIRIPNLKNDQKETKIILQEKNFSSDTVALKKYLKPLLKDIEYVPIYNALLANGYINYYDSITKKSTDLYEKSIVKAKASKNKSLEIWTTLNYVKCLYQYRKYPEMLPQLLNLLKKVKETHESKIILPGETYKTIGWIMQTLYDYPEAEHYLKLALKYTKPNTLEYATLLDNLGVNHYKTREFEKALSYFNESSAVALNIKDTLRYAKTIGNKGIILEELKKYDQAIALLKEDIFLSEKMNDSKNTMFASTSLARIYLKNNDLINTEKAIEKAELIAVSKSYFRKSELDIIKLKLDFLKRKPNAEYELIAHRRMLALEDSLKKADGEDQINLLNWQIQKDKYKYEIQKAEKTFKKEDNKKIFFLILSIIFSLFIVCVFVYQLKKNKKERVNYEEKVKFLENEKTSIEQDLETTNNNLSNQIVYLKNKKHQIKKLKAEIETVKSSSSYYLEKQSGKLSAILDSHLMTTENWINFKREFEKENAAFCAKLNTDFPELSDSNLRVIYLQKLGFEVSEIAEFLGISSEAIKKSKQRLKKKLGEKYNNFIEFVQKPF